MEVKKLSNNYVVLRRKCSFDPKGEEVKYKMDEAGYWKKIVENDRKAFTEKIVKLRKENKLLKVKLEKIEYEIDNSDMSTAVENIINVIKD